MQTVYKISAVLLAAVLLCIAVFSQYAFFNADTLISENENRTLAPLPALTSQAWFDASFALALDVYLSDHVLLREELIPVTRALEQWMRVQSKIRIVDMTKPN
ncbi:MAG: hypothetical protein ABIG45_03735 [Bacillota bacterium]